MQHNRLFAACVFFLNNNDIMQFIHVKKYITKINKCRTKITWALVKQLKAGCFTCKPNN